LAATSSSAVAKESGFSPRSQDKELEQLKIVMGEIESALRFSSGKFLPHHFNYLQMGNELPLLHFHGIPRYGEPRALTHEVLGRDPRPPI
jgi:diadenosine tetraphosphate (Ap4A) HIT family hydrolase